MTNNIIQAGSPQATVTEGHVPYAGTVTSSYYVSMDTIFTNTHVDNKDKVKDAVALLWYTSIESRPSQGVMGSDFQASATLYHSLLELHVITDISMPVIRQHLRDDENIKKIIITRVAQRGTDNLNKEVYSSTFENCKIEFVEEFPDKVILKIRVMSRVDTAVSFGFDNVKKGQAASGIDYATGQPKS